MNKLETTMLDFKGPTKGYFMDKQSFILKHPPNNHHSSIVHVYVE